MSIRPLAIARFQRPTETAVPDASGGSGQGEAATLLDDLDSEGAVPVAPRQNGDADRELALVLGEG